LILIPCLAVGWLLQGNPAPQAAEENPKTASGTTPTGDFVGTSECRSCHEPFYEKWAKSWHGLAMRPYTTQFARENLLPHASAIRIRDRSYQARIGGADDAIVETGPDGEKTYPIRQVMGGKNVFFFLTPFRGGRLQVLPLAFDSHKHEWYDTTGSMVRHYVGRRDEALDWTDRLFTFNGACQGCHVSQISKNYSIDDDTYHTTWREPGINCESCHGPGRRHVDLMTEHPATPGHAKLPRTSEALRLVITGEMTPDQRNSLCSQCHAKASPLSASMPPGGLFFDHFRLAALEDADFYPDGRDLGENFTQTSWMMSPCAASGKLECLACHTSSGRNKFVGAEADRACLPCHAAEVAAPAGHSHHKADGLGSRCVACHMPETAFAQMRRHDHSMLPPVPAASLKFQSPNACNLCHKDHDARWSDEWVRKWYARDYQAPLVRRGELIDAARKGQWTRLDEMVAYVKEGGSEVFATSLLRLMERTADARKWPAMLSGIESRWPMVRASAAAGVAACPDADADRLLVRAASDPVRLVRIEAAVAMSHRPMEGLDEASRAAVQKAMAEYDASLRCRPDDPLSHYNLANRYQDAGDPPAATAEYRLALRLDPTLVPAMVNLSMIHARAGQMDRAESLLRDAVRHEPTSAEANFNLGLLLAEIGKPAEAEQCLRTALKADPQFARAAYNLAILVGERNPAEAAKLCRKAVEVQPDEPKYKETLRFYEQKLTEK
jgi:tetratricopeptide (TPR) repeat protein